MGSEKVAFFSWLDDGKRCVSYHEAGHAVANWLATMRINYISIMDEDGYVNGEHYHQTKFLGAVSSQFREEFNLKRLQESRSGVVNRDGSVTPFINFHADGIKKYVQREMLISLAGPVSEVAYTGGNIFSQACSFRNGSPGSDRAHVNEMLDLFCASHEEASRDEMLHYMIKKTELCVIQHWDKIEKIARVLERDYFIRGDQVGTIIGFNTTDRVSPIFKSDQAGER